MAHDARSLQRGGGTVNVFLRAEGIQKRFGATLALKEGSINIATGRVHALLGENGAGKSTMMKVLAGHHRPDAGTVVVDSRAVGSFARWDTKTAMRMGIVAVYQELSLAPHLSVAENLFLGVEDRYFSQHNLIRPRSRVSAAKQILQSLDLEEIPVEVPVGDLSLALQQMVEVAKALARKPKLLLLDEATSSLPDEYVRKLFAVVDHLKKSHVAVVFISHRLDEIDQIADEATVFRDGINVGHADAPFDRGQLIKLMAGHEVDREINHVLAPAGQGEPIVRVSGLVLKESRPAIDVEICPGEIIGVAGLEGHGQQEFLLSLFGAHRPLAGRMTMKGRIVPRPTPWSMIARGVVLIPQSRKIEALHLDLSIRENIALMGIRGLSRWGVVNSRREIRQVKSYADRLAVRMNRLDDLANSLSGGNQQKLVFAKVLMTQPNVLLMIDPMRGVDVATKAALFEEIREMANAGRAIVIYSSDTSELVGVATRVLVFYEHHIVRTLSSPNITNAALVDAAFHAKGGDSAADVPLVTQ